MKEVLTEAERLECIQAYFRGLREERSFEHETLKAIKWTLLGLRTWWRTGFAYRHGGDHRDMHDAQWCGRPGGALR